MAAAVDNGAWGTDVPVSMPVPSEDFVLVDMGPLSIGQYGLVHNITKGDLENFLPSYLPVNDGTGRA